MNSSRVVRGGSFFYGASALLASAHGGSNPSYRYDSFGARCARSAP
jgi:formylglycine-generating enzyme required for sulfatase activity